MPKAPHGATRRCFTVPVYGGTGWGRLSRVVLVLCLMGAVGSCRAEEDDRPETAREPAVESDAPGTGQAADYELWEPSYTEVRPATAGDVEDLRQRMVDLNESSYTVSVPLMGVEIASSPHHVRVRFAAGSPDGFDVHLDPTLAADNLFGGPFVMCPADSSCVEVGGDGAGSDGPHMVNNGVDTIVFTATTIVANQRALPDVLDDRSFEDGSLATVESPSGTLDCLVSGGTPEDHSRLEGSPVDLEADPLHRIGDPEPLSTTCVDEHGLLVLLVPSLMTPVVPYGAFEPDVPDGFDDHVAPQPPGTSPAPVTPSSPTGAATSAGDDHVHEVLVAAAPIRAGESLADVQATGRLFLDAVPGDELLPGAVSSTSGLDGAALHEIAVGEQITEDSFG